MLSSLFIFFHSTILYNIFIKPFVFTMAFYLVIINKKPCCLYVYNLSNLMFDFEWENFTNRNCTISFHATCVCRETCLCVCVRMFVSLCLYLLFFSWHWAVHVVCKLICMPSNCFRYIFFSISLFILFIHRTCLYRRYAESFSIILGSLHIVT